MTESHGTKLTTFNQHGLVYDMIEDDTTKEIYLSRYDSETKMKVNIHFDPTENKHDEFVKMALDSVYSNY